MKRFSFRLEQVRRWREDQAEMEEMRLEHLHTGLRKIGEEQREITAADDRSRRAVLAQSAVTSEELGSIEALHEYSKQEMRLLKAAEQEVRARIANQLQRVLEARRRFQLLDGLREKALLTWTAARDKEQEELGAESFLSRMVKKPKF